MGPEDTKILQSMEPALKTLPPLAVFWKIDLRGAKTEAGTSWWPEHECELVVPWTRW